MKIYYAHHMFKYDTEDENNEIKQIKKMFKNYEIINPNGSIIENGNSKDAMKQCFDLIRKVDILIFTTLEDGNFGKGVYDEIGLAIDLNIPVFFLRENIFIKVNKIEEISKIIVESTKSNRRFATITI
ncbi:MAG: hypothetical protein RSA91_00935 [Bacilli bacterium]